MDAPVTRLCPVTEGAGRLAADDLFARATELVWLVQWSAFVASLDLSEGRIQVCQGAGEVLSFDVVLFVTAHVAAGTTRVRVAAMSKVGLSGGRTGTLHDRAIVGL